MCSSLQILRLHAIKGDRMQHRYIKEKFARHLRGLARRERHQCTGLYLSWNRLQWTRRIPTQRRR
jgi:hypothetical protein